MEKGKFYCLEGIDGAGKTAIAHKVSEYLNKNNRCYFIDKKNTDQYEDSLVRQQMENIKKSLWDYPKNLDLEKMSDYHWITLIASWYSVLEKACIRPILESGNDVIVDGWIYKYIARFNLKEGISREMIKNIFLHVPQPDYVCLLGVEPKVAASRKGYLKSSEAGLFDGENGDKTQGFINYQTRVNKELNKLAHDYSWIHIDTNTYCIDDVTKKFISVTKKLSCQ